MHLLLVSFSLVPLINGLIMTRIHQNAIYRPHSPCVFLGNSTLLNDPSIQSCIWECVHQVDCQTAVYFSNGNICSTFSELCENGSIQPAGSVSASVICYRKNHGNRHLFLCSEDISFSVAPVSTCSSTTTTNEQQQETSSQSKITTSTQQGMYIL